MFFYRYKFTFKMYYEPTYLKKSSRHIIQFRLRILASVNRPFNLQSSSLETLRLKGSAVTFYPELVLGYFASDFRVEKCTCKECVYLIITFN